MEPSAWVTVTFTVAALLLAVVGLIAQEWQGPEGPLTGGRHDATWGTWLTDYVIAVEGFTMALYAPGTTMAQTAFRVACVLEACSWGAAGVLHLVFPAGGAVHDAMWSLGLVSQTLAVVVRLYAAQVAVTALGKCKCCLGDKSVARVFGGIAMSGVVLIILAVYELIPVQDWLAAAGINAVSCLAMAVYGCVGKAYPWAGAVLLTFALGAVLNIVKPSPFLYSTAFNDNGFFHCAVMLYLVALYRLFQDLTQSARSDPAEIGAP